MNVSIIIINSHCTSQRIKNFSQLTFYHTKPKNRAPLVPSKNYTNNSRSHTIRILHVIPYDFILSSVKMIYVYCTPRRPRKFG